MAIKTRETNGTGVTNKDAPLTNAEVDNNFIELVAEDATKLDLSGGTLTGNVSTSGLLSFGNSTAITNNRIRLGAGPDLQIYHDGVDSFIQNGSSGGTLNINNQAASDVVITAHDSQSANTQYFRADSSAGEAQLFHLGSKKLATTSTGVQTTGTLSLNGAYTFPTSDGSANQVLQTDGSGTLSFATVSSGGLSNVVEDTTPELGGTLEADGYNVEFTDSSAATDGRVKFGTGNDLQIYHNGSRSYIEETGGPLMITQSSGSDIVFQNLKASPSTSLTTYLELSRSTGQVNAYHYGSLKLETKSTGIQVNGTITLTDGLGNTTYAFPTADGSANQVLQTDGSGTLSFATVSGGGSGITVQDEGTNLSTAGTTLNFVGAGVQATGQSTTKTITIDQGLPTTGGTMTGVLKLNDNVELQVGSGSPDFSIHHNGTNTRIQNYTGELEITNYTDDSDVRILSDNGSGGTTDYFKADGSNGEAVLYHYGSEKLATKSTGVQTTGTLNVNGAYTLPTSDGSANQVLQTDGSGTLSFATVSSGGSGITSLVQDTTPELGGTLDLNGQTVTQSVGAINIENQNSNKNINLSVGQGHTVFAVTGSGVELDDSNKTAKFGGDGSTGGVTLANGYVDIRGKSVSEATYVNFYCESSNAHAVKLQAPAHADFSGNITTTLPNTTGTLVTSNAQRRIEVVSALPSSPDSNTIYFVT